MTDAMADHELDLIIVHSVELLVSQVTKCYCIEALSCSTSLSKEHVVIFSFSQ